MCCSATVSRAPRCPPARTTSQATYRIGSGAAGNVGAGTITTLMDRPLGVSGVINPQAATGGQDAQSVDRCSHQCAALGADSGPGGFDRRLSELRGQLRRHRQGDGALDSERARGAASSSPSPARAGRRLPPGNPTLGNLITVAADIRQSAAFRSMR